MAEESDGKIHSGCTVVTALLRIEDPDGKQSFKPMVEVESPISDNSRENSIDGTTANGTNSSQKDGASAADVPKDDVDTKAKDKIIASTHRIRKALRSLGGGSSKVSSSSTVAPTSSAVSKGGSASGTNIIVPPAGTRCVLYCANAGDARGVLCRSGKAVRLTYDHKGTDKQEAKRITDAGGFVMSGRVNGVLAVTRSLGDSSMKEFVVGAPYTTETELCSEDEFLILACDGVRQVLFLIQFLLDGQSWILILTQLWDIVGDQGAIDLVRDVQDAQEASDKLLNHAISHHTTDNVTVIVVRLLHDNTSSA